MDFLIRALATWRISSLLIGEEGPFGIFVRLRHWAGVRTDSKNRAYVEAEEGQELFAEFGKLFTCIWCMSFWVGVAVSFLPSWLLLPFALSAGALIANKQVGSRG